MRRSAASSIPSATFRSNSRPIPTGGTEPMKPTVLLFAKSCFPVVVAFWVAASNIVSAADKSAVGPSAISVPKGPGSIEGLGESFQPSLNTGTAKYGISIKVPPGPAGHAPAFALSYEGGGGNGSLGLGWALPIPYIQCRSDKGIPTYGQNVGFPRQ